MMQFSGAATAVSYLELYHFLLPSLASVVMHFSTSLLCYKQDPGIVENSACNHQI